MSSASMDLELKEVPHDPVRRQEFFKTIVQDEIASQILALRKKRKLKQSDIAQRADMKQSAVSRIEQADYSSWTLTTLLRVAAALDARWRMILQPCEEAIKEYEKLENPDDEMPTENALRAFSESASALGQRAHNWEPALDNDPGRNAKPEEVWPS